MFINKIYIQSFGKFKDFTLELKNGVNLLEAENEYGKSTISAFLNFVFYGFVTSKNKRIEDNDKKHYIPWDSDFVCGFVDICDNGVCYRIERRYTLPSREIIKVTDLSNLKELKNITEPGKHFFGVGSELFSKTIYFTQMSTPLNHDADVADSIRNICVSSDEQTSIEKAKKRLNDLKTSIKNHQNNGMLPDAQEEYVAVEQKYNDALKITAEIKEIDEKIRKENENLKNCEKEYRKYIREREGFEKYEAYKQLRRLDLLDNAEAEAKKKLKEGLVWFKDGKMPDPELVQNLRTGFKEYNVLCDKVGDKRNEFEKVVSNTNKISQKKDLYSEDGLNSDIVSYKSLSYILFFFLFAVFSIAAVAIWFILKNNAPLTVASAVLAVVFFILFISKTISRKNILKKYQCKNIDELSELLSLIKIEKQQEKDDSDIIDDKKQEVKKAEQEADKQKYYILGITDQISSNFDQQDTIQIRMQMIIEHISETQKLISNYQERKKDREASYEGVDLEELKKQAENAEMPLRTKAEIDFSIRYTVDRRSVLTNSILTLEKQRSALEASYSSLSVLETKKTSLKNKIEQYKTEYKALETALDYIERSSDILKSSIIPSIEKYASEAIDQATDGRYENIILQNDFSIDLGKDSVPMSLDYMSAGTKELAYIILRNALIRLYFEDKTVPVIIDDALVRLDGKREKEALKLITQNKNIEQVIIFSSLKREKEILNELNVPFNKL